MPFHLVPDGTDERSRSPIWRVAEGALVGVVVGNGVGVFVEVAVGVALGKDVDASVAVGVEVGMATLAIMLYAASTSTRPVPNVLSGPIEPRSTAEPVNALRRSATLKFGNALSSKAMAPETCGAANDVPVAE